MIYSYDYTKYCINTHKQLAVNTQSVLLYLAINVILIKMLC